MRNYPFLREVASGTEALGSLARAGLMPPQPVLAISEPAHLSYYTPTVHLNPACPPRSAKTLTITALTADDLTTIGDGIGPTPCPCQASDALAGWLEPRLELATALWILEVVEEQLPLDEPTNCGAVDELRPQTSPWESGDLRRLGAIRAAHYGLTHATGTAEVVTDWQLANMTQDAFAALGHAIDVRTAAHVPQPDPVADLHRWVVDVTNFIPGSTGVPDTQGPVFEAIARGGLLGAKPCHSGTRAALLSPVELLGPWGGAVDLGPARVAVSADEVFATFDVYQQVRDQLVVGGASFEDAASAALTSVRTASCRS